MAPNLWLYQLLLVPLVLICLLIHVGWPDNLSATSKISQIPSGLVVKSQPIDVAEVIFQ